MAVAAREVGGYKYEADCQTPVRRDNKAEKRKVPTLSLPRYVQILASCFAARTVGGCIAEVRIQLSEASLLNKMHRRTELIRQTVADVIRTCLGPKAMLKMILDPMGGIL